MRPLAAAWRISTGQHWTTPMPWCSRMISVQNHWLTPDGVCSRRNTLVWLVQRDRPQPQQRSTWLVDSAWHPSQPTLKLDFPFSLPLSFSFIIPLDYSFPFPILQTKINSDHNRLTSSGLGLILRYSLTSALIPLRSPSPSFCVCLHGEGPHFYS